MEPSNTNLNNKHVQSLINDIYYNELGGLKQLSQEERKVLKTAIEKFFKGESANISKSIEQKIANPRKFIKNPAKSDGISKVFNEKHLGSKTLAGFISSLDKADVVKIDKPRNVEIANRTMWKILGNCLPVQGTEEIVITGQVLGDGRGDWAAIRNMQKSLQKKFPDRTVRIIASSAEKWNKPGALDTSRVRALDLIYYGNSAWMGEKVPLSAFPPESNIIEKVLEAGVIISAGVGIGSVFESVLNEISEKSIKIKEHDFGTASASKEFGSIVLQTGINPADDRVGIFVSKEKEYSWDNIANTHLKSFLFNTDNPSEKDLDEYRSTHECFFGYMHDVENNILFIRDAASFANSNSPNKFIDVCLPGFSKKRFLDFNARVNLQDSDIGKLVLVWYEGDQRNERTILLGEGGDKGKGQEVRVIDPGSISAKDFKIMTKISGPIVGCTGDNSLAQTLSSGKIPCYEPRFPEKALGLIRRVEENFGKESPLYQYCNGLMNNSDRDSIIASLPGLAEQAKQLGKFMREEAAFQPVLAGVVNEKLLRQKDPDFADREDQLRQNYLDNKISMKELTTQFRSLLAEKNLLKAL